MEDTLDQLNQTYGKETPLVIHQGPIQEYLGMTINFGMPGAVQFTMDQYIKNLITEYPPKLTTGLSSTPAGTHLFQVNEIEGKLPPVKPNLIIISW